MCLIAFALDAHPDYALVLAANRDEFYDRPTAPAHFWADEDGLLAGRDERAGGTWMGLTRAGRFAALTNVRDASMPERANAPSRGQLVTDFLRDDRPPARFAEALASEAERYNGFNLLLGTFGGAAQLLHCTNRNENTTRRVAPGVHGLSNASLDTTWPKVETAKAALRRTLATGGDPRPEGLIDLMNDAEPAPADALPDTGVAPEWERALSSIFIRTDGYGTRSSTALLVARDGAVTFVERTFASGGSPTDRRFSFEVGA